MAEVKVRMDRSRDFSTIHGARTPNDRHRDVHFYQDGLPFDSRGFLMPDHPDVTENPELAKLADRKLKKAAKAKVDAPGDDADAPSDDASGPEPINQKAAKAKVDAPGDDADAPSDDASGPEPINLEAWARGEQQVPWQEVSNAIAKRFTRRVPNKQAAIEFLVDEKIVAIGDLAPEYQKLVKELV